MKGEAIVILLVEDDEAHAKIVRRNTETSRMINQLMVYLRMLSCDEHRHGGLR